MKKNKLGDLIEVRRGKSLAGEFYATSGNLIRLTMGNFDYINNCFKYNTSKDNLYFSGKVEEKFILNAGDIITPLTEQTPGLLGCTARIPESGKFIQSQDVALVKCKKDKLDDGFAYYLISSESVKKQLGAAAQQTKIRHTSPDKIKDCIVYIPEISIQKRIGKILSTLDQRIENLRAQNQVLEQTAKAIYDYTFLQCASHQTTYNKTLNRNIPANWEVKKLSEIANITMGQSPEGSSYNENGFGEIFYQGSTDFGTMFPTPRQYTTAPTRFAKINDILMSVRAPVGTLNIANTPCCIGRGLAALNSKDGSNVFLYYVMKNFESYFNNAYSIGTTFGSITKNDLYDLPVLYPDSNTLNKFDSQVTSIFQKQLINAKQIEALTTQRNTLLPLLMTGQIEV